LELVSRLGLGTFGVSEHQKHIILVENIQLGYDIKFDIDFLDLFMTYIASNLEMICSSKLYSNCSKLI
jgi:hypothetical protein